MPDSHSRQPTAKDYLPRTKVGNSVGLTQAYELRDLAANEALALQDAPLAESETTSARAQALSALVRAWETAVERIRIMRGRPLPGSLKPENKSSTAKPRKPVEPIGPSDP